MVFVYLLRHWMVVPHFRRRITCTLRGLRVLLFYSAHVKLVKNDIYCDYLPKAQQNVFHHLCYRNYLAKGLSLRERVRCVLTHYQFEQETFDKAYRQQVYRDGGLVLWQHEVNGRHFAISLEMAARTCGEGDLTLMATADGVCLHRLSFSWVNGDFVGFDLPILPFVARNQGHRKGNAHALEAFEQSFPNNSPSFSCAAALQGIAQTLGMDRFVAIKSIYQNAFDAAEAERFSNAYDHFWQTLGGTSMEGRTWQVALPFQLRPLSETPAKHRKRAAMRRENWRLIAESAQLALQRHLVHANTRELSETVVTPTLAYGC